MRSRMRTMHGHYLSDAAKFAAFNPELGGSFGTDWLAALEAADLAPNVDVRRGELRQDTVVVETEMDRARAMVQQVFYYVSQAFPGNKGRLSQYGKDRYAKAATNSDEMRVVLDMAAQAAERDLAALTTKGFSAAKLAELQDLAAQLDTVDTAQQMQKGLNQEDTDAYVRLQNAAFGFGQRLNKAAKLLLADQPLRQRLYRLTDPAPTPTDTHELTLALGEQQVVSMETRLLPDTVLRLTLLEGSGPVRLGRLPFPAAPLGSGELLDAATSPRYVSAAELGPEGQYLAAHNLGPDEVRVSISLPHR